MTHQQILEERYGDADWYQEFIEEPYLPFEINLWYQSFRGIADENTDLPYQFAHIWVYLLEVGPVISNGNGPVSISFTEIQSWMSCTGIKLSRWEISLLRQCSQQWISAQYEAKNPNATPPWVVSSPEPITERRKRVAERLKSLGGKGKK